MNLLYVGYFVVVKLLCLYLWSLFLILFIIFFVKFFILLMNVFVWYLLCLIKSNFFFYCVVKSGDVNFFGVNFNICLFFDVILILLFFDLMVFILNNLLIMLVFVVIVLILFVCFKVCVYFLFFNWIKFWGFFIVFNNEFLLKYFGGVVLCFLIFVFEIFILLFFEKGCCIFVIDLFCLIDLKFKIVVIFFFKINVCFVIFKVIVIVLYLCGGIKVFKKCLIIILYNFNFLLFKFDMIGFIFVGIIVWWSDIFWLLNIDIFDENVLDINGCVWFLYVVVIVVWICFFIVFIILVVK